MEETNTNAPATDTPRVKPLAVPEEVLAEGRANRSVLMAWLMKLSSDVSAGHLLLTRSSDNDMWRHTGIFINEEEQRVYGVVSGSPYQPIGLIDDDVFIPNEGNKLFWQRQFSLVKVVDTAYEKAFQPVPLIRSEAEELGTVFSNPARVSAEEVMRDLEAEVARVQALDLTDRAVRDRAQKDINAFLVLQAMKLVHLDRLLSDQAKKHPELGTQLEKADQVPLLLSIKEWLRTKLLDDDMARKAAGVVMVRKDLDLASAMLQSLEKALPEGDVSAVDTDALERVVHAVYLCDKLSRSLIDQYVSRQKPVLDTVRALISDYKRRLANG